MLRLKSNHSGIFVTSLLFTAMRLGEDMKMPHNDSSTFVHPSFHQYVCGNSVCALILDDFSIAAPAYSGLSSFLNPIITIIYKTNSRKVFTVIRVHLELSSPACHEKQHSFKALLYQVCRISPCLWISLRNWKLIIDDEFRPGGRYSRLSRDTQACERELFLLIKTSHMTNYIILI